MSGSGYETRSPARNTNGEQANYIRIDPGHAVAHIINMPLIPSESRIDAAAPEVTPR